MIWPFRRPGASMRRMTPTEARQELHRDDVVLLDVREDFEFRHCRIDGAVHIPLRQLLQGGESALDPDKEIICYCHHGFRSRRAAQYLLTRGFTKVANLAGGIEAWSKEVDHDVPTY
ncbi:MAG: rhodanese-like domain-containing protein [Acidobacteriota bacterium]|jgi:sulfur-carrier protein adenylyltransferase/sulfurtransferase